MLSPAMIGQLTPARVTMAALSLLCPADLQELFDEAVEDANPVQDEAVTCTNAMNKVLNRVTTRLNNATRPDQHSAMAIANADGTTTVITPAQLQSMIDKKANAKAKAEANKTERNHPYDNKGGRGGRGGGGGNWNNGNDKGKGGGKHKGKDKNNMDCKYCGGVHNHFYCDKNPWNPQNTMKKEEYQAACKKWGKTK